MSIRPKIPTILLCAGLTAAAAASSLAAVPGTHAALPNKATGQSATKAENREEQRARIVTAQVLLERAGFSTGAIDGMKGDNLKKALIAFQRANNIENTGELDQATLDKLAAFSSEPVLMEYEITEADVAGPFTPEIPADLEDQANLSHLDYTGPKEALAEKFHMDERLLTALNPNVDFSRAGTRITVANVPHDEAKPSVNRIVIDKTERSISAFDASGTLVAFYPVSIGSEEKPAPSGTYKVLGVQKNPEYHYDPKYAFKEVKVQRKFTVKPGPNNPVGVVWIALSAPSYGIHGTPNPEKISRSESHGCIRMTNWDAVELASMVHPGTIVEFQDSSPELASIRQ